MESRCVKCVTHRLLAKGSCKRGENADEGAAAATFFSKIIPLIKKTF